MTSSRKTHYERLSATRDSDTESGVSFSIQWKRSGWAVAAAIAAIVVARVLGLF